MSLPDPSAAGSCAPASPIGTPQNAPTDGGNPPLYHGTTAVLAPGDILVPGDVLGLDNWGMENAWGVWLTPDPAVAARYGPNVYAVEGSGLVDWCADNGWERTPENDEWVADRATVVSLVGKDAVSL